MDIKDVFPPPGLVQRIYCDECDNHLDLTFTDFDETVSGIRISIEGLPTLRCPACGEEYWPDRSRFAIINVHKKCFDRSAPGVEVKRTKLENDFGFTKVPFIYDPDDYFYIPGLERRFDEGFLQPVFFKRQALLKYDNSPNYRVQFASTSYGNIISSNDDQIAFGINRFGNLVMWLGDVAKLPESEQYYLRSENIESDHSIGSEFYDGQIEVKFTNLSAKDELFRCRSAFLDECLTRFGRKIAHLDDEVWGHAISHNPPVVDTPKERRHIADTLNKIYIESFDNKALKEVLSALGGGTEGTGSLKRLQAIFETIAPGEDVASILSPLFVLYDLRVANSHLTSQEKSEEIMATVAARLGVSPKANLMTIYDRLTEKLLESFGSLLELVQWPTVKMK